MNDFETILFEKAEGIAWITLNRPEKLNAMNYVMRKELRIALDDVAEDEAVRVAVIRANGRAFSAGADLTYGAPPPDQIDQHDMRDVSHMFYEAVWCNPKPIIASVHGYVLARGGDLASFCDITLAADDSVFGYPILWQSPGTPHSMWPWMLGPKLSKELTYTGRYMSAEEAREHGLVNRVVPRDRLEEETRTLAVMLANGADKRPQKRGLNEIFDRYMGLHDALNNQWRLPRPRKTEFYGGDDPVNVAFRRRVRDEGMKAALEWRERRMRGEASLD